MTSWPQRIPRIWGKPPSGFKLPVATFTPPSRYVLTLDRNESMTGDPG